MNRLLLAILLVFTTVGCAKQKGCTDPMSSLYDPEAEEDDGSCQYAGTGGSSVIAAILVHGTTHVFGTAAYPDTAMVKFNAKESPGTEVADYDLVIAGDDGEDHVHIENLKPGFYWVHCAGFDSTVMARVTGGAMVKVASAGEEVNKIVYVED